MLLSEMNIWADDGSVNSFLTSHVDYDKAKVVKYLESGEVVSVCARHGIDCVTGEKISLSFKVMTDGEYVWCDFLLFFARPFSRKLQNIFGECCISNLEKVAEPVLEPPA